MKLILQSLLCTLLLALRLQSMGLGGQAVEEKKIAAAAAGETKRTVAIQRVYEQAAAERKKLTPKDDPQLTQLTGLTKDVQTLIKDYMLDDLKPPLKAVTRAHCTLNKVHGSFIACMGDTRYVTGSYADFTVRLWNATTHVCIREFKGHTGYITAVAAHGNLIISGSTDKTLRVWNSTTGECLYTMQEHTGAIHTIKTVEAENKDNAGYIITAASGGDKNVIIWDLADGVRVKRLTLPAPVHMLAVDTTYCTLLINTTDGKVYQSQFPLFGLLEDDLMNEYKLTPLPTHKNITWISLLPQADDKVENQMALLAGSADGTLRITYLHKPISTYIPLEENDDDDEPYHIIDVTIPGGHKTPLCHVANHHNAVLYTYACNGKEILWETSNYKNKKEFEKPVKAEDADCCVLRAELTPFSHAKYVSDGRIIIYDIPTYQTRATFDMTHSDKTMCHIPMADQRFFSIAAYEPVAVAEWQNLSFAEMEQIKLFIETYDARQAKLLAAGSKDMLKLENADKKFLLSLPACVQACLKSQYMFKEEGSACIIQ